MQRLIKFLKKRNFYISRWGFELLLLGILLVPVWHFISWTFEIPTLTSDAELIRKSQTGIVAGVMGIGIWFLGVSVIIINLLRDIKMLLEKEVNRREEED